MKIFLPVLFLWLLPYTAMAGLSFKQLESITENPPELEGRFVQEKYLTALDASLQSSGTFSYQRGKVIRWQTLKPIKSEMLVTPTSISSNQDGQVLMQLDAQLNPAAILYNEIFFSVLTADWVKLSKYFKLSGNVDDGRWNVKLMPVDNELKKVVSRVDLKGEALIHEIILYESNGDQTTIHFENLRHETR